VTRRWQLPAAGLLSLALTGCREAPPPSVTLQTAQQTVHAGATRWCPAAGSTCQTHRVPVPVVRISGRADMTIDVGPTVAKRPWLVLVEGGSASPLQHSRTFALIAVRAPVTIEVVTVDTDGSRVLQRDRWVFKVEAA
jgi:hypothetical protein